MRILFSLLSLAVYCTASAQHIPALPDKKAPADWENVSVEKIADDSLCTSFLIWVKGGVKHHFHSTHTECIYVLEGEGQMELGEEIFTVKPGDYIVVPKGKVHAVTAKIPMKVLSIQTPQWKEDDRKFVPPIRRPHNE